MPVFILCKVGRVFQARGATLVKQHDVSREPPLCDGAGTPGQGRRAEGWVCSAG